MGNPVPRHMFLRLLPTRSSCDEGQRDAHRYEVSNEFLQRDVQKEFRGIRKGMIELGLAMVVLFGALALLAHGREFNHRMSSLPAVPDCAPLSADGFCPRGISLEDVLGG